MMYCESYKFPVPHFFGILILISIVINQPFLAISFVPRIPRLFLEGLILLVLLTEYACNQTNKHTFWILGGLFLALSYGYFLSPEGLISYIGFFNKVSFGVLFYEYAKHNTQHLQFFRLSWISIWSLIVVWSVLSFFTFLFFPEYFHGFQFGKFDPNAQYWYYGSDWYQIVDKRVYFGISVGRAVGAFFEPIHLGFMAWINFLLGIVLFKERKWQILYSAISFSVGLLSFSLFYYIIAILLMPIYLIKISRRFNRYWQLFAIVWLILLAYTYFTNFDQLLSFGSGSQRFSIMKVTYRIFGDNNIVSFLFGNGINISYRYLPSAIVNGLSEILLTKGFIVLSLVVSFVVYLTRKDIILMGSVFVWSFGLHPYKLLLFYFLLVLASGLNNEDKTIS